MKEENFRFLLVFTCLEATVTGSQALECYSCQNIGDAHDCNVTVRCQSGESCYMDSLMSPLHGFARFTLGCLENQKCGRASNSMIPVGKRRQTQDCHECCSSDYCNTRLCSHHKPSACVDDERQDCAQLHSLFNICNDIQHAKLICAKFCNLCHVVDGSWTEWSGWTSCDVTCGNGTQRRTRTCTNPAPANGGDDCVGQGSESKPCTRPLCPVHGGWSRWSSWGTCSVSCDIGLQRRDRSCSNPYPSRFGDNCYGESRDDRICLQQPCADGQWADWGSWSTCSLSCGSGIQSRLRTCTNPRPSILGGDCTGGAQQTRTCSSQRCPAIISAFSVDAPLNYSKARLIFSHTIYEHGGDFDLSTGTFTCSIPGTYLFAVTLVKKRSGSRVDQVYCSLFKSGSPEIKLDVDPTDDDSDKGSAAVSQSVVLHLVQGDTVYLSDCIGQPDDYMESWSSFTGFLMYPEN